MGRGGRPSGREGSERSMTSYRSFGAREHIEVSSQSAKY